MKLYGRCTLIFKGFCKSTILHFPQSEKKISLRPLVQILTVNLWLTIHHDYLLTERVSSTIVFFLVPWIYGCSSAQGMSDGHLSTVGLVWMEFACIRWGVVPKMKSRYHCLRMWRIDHIISSFGFNDNPLVWKVNDSLSTDERFFLQLFFVCGCKSSHRF